MNFIEKYPSDPETQLELLDEFDNMLQNLTRESLFSKRFKFLLEYFNENGDNNVKIICGHYLKEIREF